MIGGRHASRGQALAETAIMVPIFLLLLFGVIWAMQLTVMGERSQVAVRYSGFISNQADPIMQYSLYALYNSLPNSSRMPQSQCIKPTSDALDNSPATFPGPLTAQLWYNNSLIGSVSGGCTQGRLAITANGLAEPALFTHTQSTLVTQMHPPAMFAGALSTVTAQQNILRTPDVTSLMACYPELGNTIQDSIVHAKLNQFAPPLPLPQFPSTAPLTPGAC